MADEATREKMAEWRKHHPTAAKVLAWSILLALLAVTAVAGYDFILHVHHQSWTKTIVLGFFAALAAVRTYRKVKLRVGN